MHALAKAALLSAAFSFCLGGTPRLGSRALTRSKTLDPRSYPPIVLNANTLAQLGLGGLSGPITGGLLPDAGQDGLHLKGGNAIW
ncbi:hypothetical protein MRX96_009795 [Rhipicephalus microplus]